MGSRWGSFVAVVLLGWFSVVSSRLRTTKDDSPLPKTLDQVPISHWVPSNFTYWVPTTNSPLERSCEKKEKLQLPLPPINLQKNQTSRSLPSFRTPFSSALTRGRSRVSSPESESPGIDLRGPAQSEES